MLWVALIITCSLPPPLSVSRKELIFLVTLAACPLPGRDCWWDKGLPFVCSTDVLLGNTCLIPSTLQREEPRAKQVCSWLSNTAALHSCKFPGSSAIFSLCCQAKWTSNSPHTTAEPLERVMGCERSVSRSRQPPAGRQSGSEAHMKAAKSCITCPPPDLQSKR